MRLLLTVILLMITNLSFGSEIDENHIKACNGGNASACTELGAIYWFGKWVKKDKVKSADFYMKAIAFSQKDCDEGNANACTKLGSIYALQRAGIHYNDKKAIEAYKKGCNGGDTDACDTLGFNYKHGMGVKKDIPKSIEFYKMGCNGGLPNACIALGGIYLFKDKVKASEFYKKAAESYEKSCNDSDTGACNKLADLYRYGKWVKEDFKRADELNKMAIELDKKACDNGDANVCINLGINAEKNQDTYQEVLEYYEKACNVSYAMGCTDLAFMYEYGKKGNITQAKRGRSRGRIKQNEKKARGEIKQNEKKAIELYKKACSGGDARACRNLGGMYKDARGAIEDTKKAMDFYKKAMDFYKKACSNFDAVECCRLGSIYKDGEIVKKDIQKAIKFYKKGCRGGYQTACFHFNKMAKKDENKEYCDTEVKKDQPNISNVQQYCIKVAKKQELDGNYKVASWYYLLAGENDKNIDTMSKEMFTNGSNIGHSYVLKGKFDEAKKSYLQYLSNSAVRIFTANTPIQNDYKLLFKLYPKKKKYLIDGLALWNEMYTSVNNIDSYYSEYKAAFNKKQYKKAISALTKSIEIQRKYPIERPFKSINDDLNNLGIAYYNDHQYKESLKVLHEVENSYDDPTLIFYDKLEYAKLLTLIAENYKNLNDNKSSLNYYEKVLAIYETRFGERQGLTLTIYNSIGEIYEKMGDYQKALQYYQKSFDGFLFNRDIFFLTNDNKRKKLYLEMYSKVIINLLRTTYLYKENSPAQAKSLIQKLLNNWLNYKGSIFDSENAIATLYHHTKDAKLKTKIDDLMANKRSLAKLYQSLPKPKEIDTWKQKIEETKARIVILTNVIVIKAESFKEQEGLKSIRYQEISANLKADELYIDYAKAGEQYYIFSLNNKENISFIQLDKSGTQQINTLVQIFRDDINYILENHLVTNEKLKALIISSKEKLSMLYKLALKQVLSAELEIKKYLIVSPAGVLRLLPFEAMFDSENDQYLIKQKEIRYISSGKELVRLYKYRQNNTDTTKQNTIIFSNPNFDSRKIGRLASSDQEEIVVASNTSRTGIIKSLFKMRFSPLPGTKEEAEAIINTLKEDKLIEYKEDQANESNLMKIKSPRILHIATHGFFINDNTIPNTMLKSGIALSGANTSAIKGDSNGIITALKLSGLKLKGTDLVVLSACQTGLVDVNSTESVSGLSKAFIQAGAKDIVMSLWSVNDQATKDLMSSFYKEMQTHSSYAKALKEAKLKMIKKDMHPFFWAPFIVNGL